MSHLTSDISYAIAPGSVISDSSSVEQQRYLKEGAEEVGGAHRHECLILELLLCAPRDVALQVELLGVALEVLAVILVDLPQELQRAVRVDFARGPVED